MLGVARNFTEAQLKRQHRLLSLRFHPDAAERNGVDPEQAAERFKAMQTAYEVLKEPGRRARYDVEMRLHRQRLWRGAWSAPPMQIVDKTGTPPTGAAGAGLAAAEGACGGGAEATAGSESLTTAKLRALQAEERAVWLQAELEEMQRRLAAVAFEKETQELQTAEMADRERREAERRDAKEAERSRRREAEKARRRAEEKLRREAEEVARVEAHERAFEEAEAMTRDMEDRVRRQVEERAVRRGTELGRREVEERLRHAEEHAQRLQGEAEEKARRLQTELDELQRRLASQPLAPPAPHGAAEDEGEAAVTQALQNVELVMREEEQEREWTRRAVRAAEAHEVAHDMAPGGAIAMAAPLPGDMPHVWMCIAIPRDVSAGESVLIDTPHGLFAVLVPMGVEPGAPLLVPVPISAEAATVTDTPPDEHAVSREQQLRELMARGFDTHTAAPYCDGKSTAEALATLIASDAAALEEETANPHLRTPRGSSRAKASVGGGSGSSACVIS